MPWVSNDSNYSEQGQSVLESSVEITVSESAGVNILKLGRMFHGMMRHPEISTCAFASFSPSLSLKKEHTQKTVNAHTVHTLCQTTLQ